MSRASASHPRGAKPRANAARPALFPWLSMLCCFASCEVIEGEPTASAAPAASQRFAGLILAHIDDDEDADASNDGKRGYGTPSSQRAMTHLKSVGASAISLSVYALADSQCDTTLSPEWESPGQETEAAIREQIKQARAAGFDVLLSPTIWVSDDGWRGGLGDCNSAPWGAADWQTFFNSYESFLSRWATVAEDTGASVLSVGLELKHINATHLQDFRTVAERASKHFSGKRLYSANWDELERLPPWNAMDYVGVNAFFPITDNDQAQFKSGMKRVATVVERVAARHSKAVIFTEMGYKSCIGAAKQPWRWPEDSTACGAVSQDYQAAAYQAALDQFWGHPQMAGMFFWKTFTDLDDRTQSVFTPQEPATGFDPIGKKAEQVLRSTWQHP